jgi:integrase
MRGPLTSLGIYRAVRRRSEMAGLDTRRIHPHAFRKFFATHWLAGGGDETRLMKVGGWASPEMLKIYILLSKQQDLATAHQLFGPVDRVLAV